jgi:hypothetical protein
LKRNELTEAARTRRKAAAINVKGHPPKRREGGMIGEAGGGLDLSTAIFAITSRNASTLATSSTVATRSANATGGGIRRRRTRGKGAESANTNRHPTSI